MITLGYADNSDLVPLQPLLRGEVKIGVQIEPVPLKEERLRFELQNLDLVYMPLSLIGNVTDKIVAISNGATVVERSFLKVSKDLREVSRIRVPSTFSPDFTVARITLLGKGVSAVRGEADGEISPELGDYDILKEWRGLCGDLPLIWKLIVTSRLEDNTISRVKSAIRESASLQVDRGLIPPIGKELGLKGRQAVACFFRKCKENGLCQRSELEIL